ncbi:MAG: Methyltransferase type 11, partial [Streptosporangiaceae bacterium]|nr:Methyltransferase type 11 [Streptosporangiaceae bacterium]
MGSAVLTAPRLRWACALSAAAAAGAWWFGDKAPYPYAQRSLLDLPLPFLTSARLDAVLTPSPGERILEVGPGTGLQSLHIAPQLGPHGQLDILDIQPEMLRHVMHRAGQRAVPNIVPTHADARELPFDDDTFDAMYLVTALGEIPEPQRVLDEAVRVLTPAGRLVVGEFFDRHRERTLAIRRAQSHNSSETFASGALAKVSSGEALSKHGFTQRRQSWRVPAGAA